MEMYIYIFIAFIFAALIGLFASTPYIGRKGSCFGVLLGDAENNAQVRKAKSRYRNSAILSGLIILAVFLMLAPEASVVYPVTLYVCLMLSLFMYNNKLINNIVRVNEWESRERDMYAPSDKIPAAPSKPLPLAWYALMIPLIAATYIVYPSDLKLPLVQVAVAVACAALYCYIRFAPQYAEREKFWQYMVKNSRSRRLWEILLLAIGVSICAVLLFLQLQQAGVVSDDAARYAVLAPFAALVAGVLWFGYRNR